MFKHRKILSVLAVPILSFGLLFSTSVSTEAAQNDKSWMYNISDTWNNWTEGHTGSSIKESQGKRPAPLGTNATEEEVEQYVRDSLNSNSPLSNDMQIKGRSKDENGNYNVAITYQDSKGNKKNVVVGLDGSGEAINVSNNDAQDMQSLYDEIVYGGGNDLSKEELNKIDDALHTSAPKFIGTMADILGISTKTASNTAAGAVSLMGMALMGAGATNQRKQEIIEKAQETVKAKAKTKRSNDAKTFMASKSRLSHSDIDAAFETMENRVSPYGSVGCVDTVCATGSYYNKDLSEAYQQGIASVPELRRNLESKGYATEEFTGSANKGDLLIYGDDNHVVIADGDGGCFGNSSSRGCAKHYDSAYNAWHTGSAPSKIIRM